jgi:hypothetical protein
VTRPLPTSSVLRSRLRRPGAPSALTLAVVLLVAAQLAVRAWVGYAGFFSLDDYVFYTRAATMPWHDPDLLLTAYNGHLMPGAMLWVWLSTAAAPLDFATVVTTCLVLQVLVDVLLWRVLVALFGRRWELLVPFAVFCGTTLTLPATVWWAAALNQLPQQLFMLLALLAHLAHVRTGRRRFVLLGVLAVAAGLTFSEKTALAMPLVLVLTWGFLVEGRWWRALVTTIRRYWLTWAAYTALAVPYVVYYLVTVPSPARSGVGVVETVELVDVSLRRAVLPGLVGGPWTWEPLGVVDSLADPHPLGQLAAVLVVVGVVVVTVRRHVGAGRAWLAAGAFLAVELLLLLGTRVPVVGVEPVAAEYRYFTDLGLVAAVCLALATLPVRLRPHRGAALELRRRPGARPLADLLPDGVPAGGLVGVVAVALVASGAASAATYRERWAANPGRDYVGNARAALPSTTDDTVLYDGVVPSAVVWQLLWPANLPSRLLEPVGLRHTRFEEGLSTDRLVAFTADGHLEPAEITGPESPPGPEPGCGWPVGPSGTDVPIPGDLFSWDWVVRISYDATADGEVLVEAGDTEVTVPVDEGAHHVDVAVTGEVPEVALTSSTTDLRLCVDDVVVGLPQPVEW